MLELPSTIDLAFSSDFIALRASKWCRLMSWSSWLTSLEQVSAPLFKSRRLCFWRLSSKQTQNFSFRLTASLKTSLSNSCSRSSLNCRALYKMSPTESTFFPAVLKLWSYHSICCLAKYSWANISYRMCSHSERFLNRIYCLRRARSSPISNH